MTLIIKFMSNSNDFDEWSVIGERFYSPHMNKVGSWVVTSILNRPYISGRAQKGPLLDPSKPFAQLAVAGYLISLFTTYND